MKTTFKMMATVVLAGFAATTSAQVVTQQTQAEAPQSAVSTVVTANSAPQQSVTLTNTQLSQQFKLQIDVINNEIKTLKSQAKLYKTDAVKSAEVTSRLASKKAELADVKAKKRIADKAIKTEKARQKAEEKAAKAARKAAEAADKAAMLQQK